MFPPDIVSVTSWLRNFPHTESRISNSDNTQDRLCRAKMNGSTVEESEFENLKTECLRSKTLFEDSTFLPSDKSLYTEKSEYRSRWKKYDIEWVRASEMVKDPQFFLGGAARFDVKQG